MWRVVTRHVGRATKLLVRIGLGIVLLAVAALLFGVNSYDPASFIGTVIVLVVVATIAGYFPARRASQIDPINALRSN